MYDPARDEWHPKPPVPAKAGNPGSQAASGVEPLAAEIEPAAPAAPAAPAEAAAARGRPPNETVEVGKSQAGKAPASPPKSPHLQAAAAVSSDVKPTKTAPPDETSQPSLPAKPQTLPADSQALPEQTLPNQTLPKTQPGTQPEKQPDQTRPQAQAEPAAQKTQASLAIAEVAMKVETPAVTAARESKQSLETDRDKRPRRESHGNGKPAYRDDGRSRKRPLEDGDESHVARHYNNRPNNTIKARRQSRILGVRNFNNFIKSLLIDQFVQPYSIGLDLGCGKGGDLLKWLKAGIDGVIGVDIAAVSIDHAKDRYRDMKSKTFWVDFCVGDPFKNDLKDIVHPKAFPVDVVSCQFAFHYAFGAEETARMALHNISMALKPGGVFFGTMPDSAYLASNLKSGATEWGNSIFRIAFDKPNPTATFEPIFGHRYMFYLTEAVEEVPEFVVPFEGFCTLALEYGLRLELKMSFMEYFNSAVRDYDIQRAAEYSNILNSDGSFKIEPEQLEASSIYMVFAFVKV